jgi:twitching motility two-component system response regulator PilG
MVLDTSPTSRKILEVILRREGHQVASFDDSREALRFLSRHGPADLLFLGLELPGMDGFDVLKYLRGEPRFRSMGTIALLNECDGILARLKALLAGAQLVVTKPLVRQLPILKGVRVMGEPVRAQCELPPEAVARILWLRRRLLPWFARYGRSFP